MRWWSDWNYVMRFFMGSDDGSPMTNSIGLVCPPGSVAVPGRAQSSDHSKNSQRIRWEVVEGDLRGEAVVRLMPLHDLLSLEIPPGSGSGAPVTQAEWRDGDNQKWRVAGQGAKFRFTSKDTGKALSVENSAIADEAKLATADVADDHSQQWSRPSLAGALLLWR